MIDVWQDFNYVFVINDRGKNVLGNVKITACSLNILILLRVFVFISNFVRTILLFFCLKSVANQKLCFYLLQWMPFKNNEKFFFYFMSKALFVFKLFTFLFSSFGYMEERLDKKAKVNSKICDITDWTRNNFNRHVTQYLKK